ncbi:MAG: phosphatidylglycerophosphatase A, partial [Blastocatellia bacterium]|nr:phosphatidylglycerophosphatase A [Blastocatellia bacterium]
MAIKKATTLLPAKNATDWAAVIIATGLGSGYSPVAPGTAGTILAVPLYILLTFYLQISLISYLIFTLIIIIIGSITAQRAGKHFGQVDAGHIVIDEIA